MTGFETLERIQAIARDVLDEERLSFDEDTSFDDIEEWDSLNHIHMVSRLETEFEVCFELSSLQNLSRIGDLVRIIDGLQGA